MSELHEALIGELVEYVLEKRWGVSRHEAIDTIISLEIRGCDWSKATPEQWHVAATDAVNKGLLREEDEVLYYAIPPSPPETPKATLPTGNQLQLF